jgi:hypothetical protein
LRGAGRVGAGLGAALALLALSAPAAPAAASDVRKVEAVGVVPLRPDHPPRRPPRDSAVAQALASAVRRVAQEELPDFDPELDAASLDEALGREPLDYATRFRIVEDRGERPALFSDDPEVEREYVVLVEVSVDAERVRQKLTRSGLMAGPSRTARRQRVQLVIEDVETWASYRAVRTLLEDVGVQSAVPVEMERGRAVLEVDGSRGPEELMTALVRAAPPNLRLVLLGSDAGTLRLRARFLDSPAVGGAR